ncbi:hypothetical protein ACTXT7_010501 [Hymenolepis weldensis]
MYRNEWTVTIGATLIPKALRENYGFTFKTGPNKLIAGELKRKIGLDQAANIRFISTSLILVPDLAIKPYSP